MLSRVLTLTVAVVLCGVTAAAQSVTFTATAYPNNLWSQNGQINGHVRADLNGDGIEDFISQNDGTFSGGCTGSFAVALSNSNGTYAAPVCYTLPNGDALLFATGDFYGYGTLDVIVANQYGELYIYQNNGNGSLHLENDFAITGVPSGIVAADVNHDGSMDLVYDVPTPTGLSTLHVYFGNGHGTFTEVRPAVST